MNCSLEQTSWRINIYQSAVDILEPMNLLASQLVYITDPEIGSNLSIALRVLESLDDDNDNEEIVKIVEGVDDDDDDDDDDDASNMKENESSSENTEYEDEENKLLLLPNDSFNANSLWILESQSLLTGGPVKWKTERIRFRHLNTGLYLCSIVKIDEVSGTTHYVYIAIDDPTNPGTLFEVDVIHSVAKYLESGKPLQIGNNGVWIDRGDILADSIFSFTIKGTKDKNSALALLITRFENDVNKNDSKAKGIPTTTTKTKIDNNDDDDSTGNINALLPREPMDVFSGLSIRNYLNKYYQMIEFDLNSRTSMSSTTIWPSGHRNEFEVFKMIIQKTMNFSQGFLMSSTNIELGIDRADAELKKQRQNLLREQLTIEILLRSIHKLIPMSEIKEVPTIVKMGREVLEQCFDLLFYCIADNPENQIYVADHMPVLLAHLSTQKMAAECVTEMLSKNVELQETKIGTREIQIFVDKVRASDMNAMYLQLLQACCSCEGDGVDANQGKVADMLFNDNFEDIIVKVETNYNHLQRVKWNNGKKNLFLKYTADCPLRGHQLMTDGVPELLVSYMIDKEVRMIPFDEIFRVTHTKVESRGGGGSRNIRSSISRDPTATTKVADYLIAEMFLGAEMCLDRNYVAMHKLDPLFSYEVLLTMMKLNYIGELKSAAIRLLMCQHVDRDPQATTKIPRLTRIWSEIKKNPEPQLPYVEPHRANTFGLIQQLISEHIRGMARTEWTEYSKYVLNMLHTLIKFDFYGTTDRINDVIGPLIDALDRKFLDSKQTNTSDDKKDGDNNNSHPPSVVVIEQLDKISSSSNDSYDEGSSLKLKRNRLSSISSSVDSDNDVTVKKKRKDIRGSFFKGLGMILPIDSDIENEEDNVLDEEANLIEIERKQQQQPDVNHDNNNDNNDTDDQKSMARKMHIFLHSTFWSFCIIILCLIDLAEDLYQFINHLPATVTYFNKDITSYKGIITILIILKVIILFIFIVEYFARFFLEFYLEKNVKAFLYDFTNYSDVIAITADIFLVAFKFPGGFAIMLRCFKVVRLLKLFPVAVEVVNFLEGESDVVYQLPDRYNKRPAHELETMVEAVDILAFMQRLIEDRNVSLIMHNFYSWESDIDKRSPIELFEQAIIDSKSLTLDIKDFNSTMLDVLMFNHPSLVQSALEVLMSHYSARGTLLENCKNVQLLASNKREKQYYNIYRDLRELEQNAETHELWGLLKSPDDRIQNEHTKDIMRNLTNLLKIRREILEFDEDYMADTEIQDLYRNLGCFDICMKMLGLFDSVEEGIDDNGILDEIAQNTTELCLLCNNLLYWFFLGNSNNQESGYEELEFFLETLDSNINSHLVIRAIFKNNEHLMKQVPHSHLADLVERIIKDGKSHHYLSLFASITNVGDKNILENQFEIVRSLTSPGRLQKVACFFIPIDHPDYNIKKELMKPFLDIKTNLSLDDLPPLLAYHLIFLEVLSGCTVGRMNITTVEAKVQSVFNYVDIVRSILDEGTITVTKIKLGLFFYNSIIEVELKISGLEQSAYIWELLYTYDNLLVYAKDQLRIIEKLGWDSPDVNRQTIEYIVVSMLIIGGFFKSYYDTKTFRFNEHGGGGNSNDNNDKVQISRKSADELIHSLFYKAKEIYELDSPILSDETKESFFTTMQALNNASTKIIIHNLQPSNSRLSTIKIEKVTKETKLIEKYKSFIEEIEADSDVSYKNSHESIGFISILEKLPSVNDKLSMSDIRYELLIMKLIQHIRDSFTFVDNQKRLDPRVSKTSAWIIRAFRTMIENRMGMSIYERDEDGGKEQDEAAAPVVNALNSCGATVLCLDLIADGIDDALQLEAIKLGVGLLFKEGGALEVQSVMSNHLMKTESSLFFKQVRNTIQKIKEWHEWNEIIILKEGEDPSPPENILILRFLQLMCEGHYLPNQDIMREQPNNPMSYNILDDFVSYLTCLCKFPCRTSTAAGVRLTATILEVIQGPCSGNQAHFGLETELIEALNRLNRSKVINDCIAEEEIELKRASIDIFQGLLEGQGKGSLVFERILSVIHFDIIQMMSKPTIISDDKMVVISEDEINLQTECVVLLQMLCNYKPSLYDELGISRNIEDIVGSGTAMIEVIWRGDIHRRFFHIPKICDFLAKSSKDNLVETVNRTNSENKLIDFLFRSHNLYREIKHQQLLTELGISGIFSRRVQNIATWITFTTAVVINALFITYYAYDDNGNFELGGPLIKPTINILNYFQNIIGFFVVIMDVVVRSPVIFQALQANGYNNIESIVFTASDPSLLYYVVYEMLSLLGLYRPYFLPLLLLDIVAKNATTRDVLNSVVIPRQQLLMTCILAVFLTYIFAFFLVRRYL